jgi:hypothetical protein
MDEMTMTARRRTLRRAAAFALGLAILAAAPAAAQQAAQPKRGDFALALGVGYAAAKADCSNCGSDKESGASYGEGAVYSDVAAVAIAPVWWVNPKIAAGVELQAESSRTEARAVYLLGIVRFHPWERRGFFLRGGYGLVQVKAPLTLPDGTVSTAKYRGMALTYGAGWMFRQNSRVAWGPYAAHYVGTLGSAVIGSFQAQNIIGNTWFAGVGVVFN